MEQDVIRQLPSKKNTLDVIALFFKSGRGPCGLSRPLHCKRPQSLTQVRLFFRKSVLLARLTEKESVDLLASEIWSLNLMKVVLFLLISDVGICVISGALDTE